MRAAGAHAFHFHDLALKMKAFFFGGVQDGVFNRRAGDFRNLLAFSADQEERAVLMLGRRACDEGLSAVELMNESQRGEKCEGAIDDGGGALSLSPFYLSRDVIGAKRGMFLQEDFKNLSAIGREARALLGAETLRRAQAFAHA